MLCGLHLIATPIRLGPCLEVQQLTLRSCKAVPRADGAQRQLAASDCHAYDQNAQYKVQFCLLCRDRHILRHIFRLGITQHISARPNRFDMIFAAGGFAQFLTKFTNENIYNFKLRFIHTTVKMV